MFGLTLVLLGMGSWMPVRIWPILLICTLRVQTSTEGGLTHHWLPLLRLMAMPLTRLFCLKALSWMARVKKCPNPRAISFRQMMWPSNMVLKSCAFGSLQWIRITMYGFLWIFSVRYLKPTAKSAIPCVSCLPIHLISTLKSMQWHMQTCVRWTSTWPSSLIVWSKPSGMPMTTMIS